jgi:hypothetical protein
MKVHNFSIAYLDIPQSHNGLQREFFDRRDEGRLKLHPKHIKNYDRFLKVATLKTCQNSIITSTIAIIAKPCIRGSGSPLI